MITTQNLSPSLLVLGAGELGLSVLRALSDYSQQQGTRITVLLKPASIHTTSVKQLTRLNELSSLGISLLSGDLQQQSVNELADLFRPFDAVINCSGFVGGAGTQLKITEAVLEARVSRYFPWQFGVDYDLVGKGSGQQVWDEQLEVRQRLRAQSETVWTIISTGIFTSYLFEPSFGVVDIDNSIVCALGDWQNAITVTTPEDIGRLTALIFFQHPPLRNQVVFVAGDTLTWAQLAEVVEKHGRDPVTRVLLTHEQLKRQAGENPQDAGVQYRLAFARKNGVAWDKSITFNGRLGIPVTDVAQWLRQNR